MNVAWWFMAAHHELEQAQVRAPEPVLVHEPEPEPEPVKPKRLACPRCGRSGRGIAKHIRHCKG